MRSAAKVLGGVAALGLALVLCGVAFSDRASAPTVTVQLPANRAAGLEWTLDVEPAGSFQEVSQDYAAVDGSHPDSAGVQTFVLRATCQGDSTVSFSCVNASDGSVDSTAVYRFSTDGPTISRESVDTDISSELMAPWEAESAA
ncbi:protease inhibitor I42 family protein [Kribbibacterium absianum]|uniref:protease inhibitor I42 family protein n=1 Tax=Kribbibacterium absianum TaxID=3044210 RepID=UPI0024BCEF3B|nr:protease inhibitor I42 family protein [Olsenella sp. YH-ols2216]